MPVAMKEKSDSSYVDYIGNYERVMEDVVQACGGRQQANQMLGEMRAQYEKTNLQLHSLKRLYAKDSEKFATEKVRLLTTAQADVNRIIQKYAPGSADRVRELVFGTSLAMSAMLVPVTYAVSALSVATSIVSVGSHFKQMSSGRKPSGTAFAGPKMASAGRIVKKK